ncbi:MAG: VWA domain-containing protein, partial [Planctomycetota bacterium]|nr:VWA domain-containing protein [Planctomycetota bacterium]
MRSVRTIHSSPLAAWLLLLGCGYSLSSAAVFEALHQEGPPEAAEHTPELEIQPSPANAQDDSPVVMRAALSHPAYTRSIPGTLALKIDLAGAVGEASGQRPVLNLALVIDRSGSMADDDKFEYVMQAARLVVENLSQRDVVSVVAFNQEAVVLSPAGPAVNRAFLDHRLDEIAPVGWTNLSAGLLEAFAQID